MEELIRHLVKVNVPGKHDRIYKDECVYSFDTPDTSTGLYVNLTTFLGLGQDHVERYYQLTENPVFLHIKRRRKEIPSEHLGDGPDKKITRLAIGTSDGFIPDQQKYTYHETYQIVILPHFIRIPYPTDNLPQKVDQAIKFILEAESATKVAEVEALSGTWDGEIKAVSKHAANLKQLDNGKKIPPSGWKCEECDLTQNLWLNLTDGSILCGRKFYDGTGGNDHAVKHYRNTGYPLAVKLGTITKEGKGDVFSYDEDDMVEDPNLILHLSHWGINITQMEKTDKSMVELELDLNHRFGEWVALQEAASKLTPMYGPGYTGLANLGNSCYLNSTMQMLFVIPDFIKRFVDGSPQIFHQSYTDPANDFNVQMAKLGIGLLSGKYSVPPNTNNEDESRQGIPPRMFKTLIGRGHPGFSSNRQQDAQEFFLHLINIIDRHSRHQMNPTDCFKFKVEERYQCGRSNKVKYNYRPEYLLPLPIPLETALNKEEVAAYEALKKETEAKGQTLDSNALVRPRIKLSSCLQTFIRSEIVEQFYSSALNEKTTAQKTTRLSSFPDYLLIHLKKFTVKEDWTPVKLDVAVEMPDMLDLSSLRGSGLQPTEELLPETAGSEPPPIVYDTAILNQLTDIGFPPEACKRALYFTDNRGLEVASNWLMDHIGDSDFADQFVPPGIDAKPGKDKFTPNEDAVAVVVGMGFTSEQAVKALKATGNNLERAADWIFSHQAELDALEIEDEAGHSEEIFRDGSNQYKLVGFISHMGTSTMVGHYVCHLLKDERWVIYNDDKVALSENPPKELGYIYLYQRID
ncbi:ubiquitin carboxyl-terminal hydrolase 5 [Hylaeus anthracinus]|uniref:ubiquitin carboxyl-terminal hydrolase 5 n=1 Tax=Hylaeus volcanicus TaxID=313075 RepID=UPI0023B83F96|nr:ubiquitin carboxyl-terminal hydrolase 5 [Hylaeus volcanicus]XP_054010496.1 ubiquitin carboxyl-terminal hydrolase 5 [Hylaeus anthracinus]